jgi:ribosomal protein S18 acetylase RimI-like enzyme
MRSFAPCRLILEKTVAGPRPLTLLEGVGEQLLKALCVPRWSLHVTPYPTTQGVKGIQHAQEHKQTVGMVYYDLRTGKVQVCVCVCVCLCVCMCVIHPHTHINTYTNSHKHTHILQWLAVAQEHKGGGLGKLLMAAAIEHIKTGDAQSTSLTVCRDDLERSPGLLGFYQVRESMENILHRKIGRKNVLLSGERMCCSVDCVVIERENVLFRRQHILSLSICATFNRGCDDLERYPGLLF